MSRNDTVALSNYGTDSLIADVNSIKKKLGVNDKAEFNTITSILRYIKQLQISNDMTQRVESLWRRVLKTSYYTHLRQE